MIPAYMLIPISRNHLASRVDPLGCGTSAEFHRYSTYGAEDEATFLARLVYSAFSSKKYSDILAIMLEGSGPHHLVPLVTKYLRTVEEKYVMSNPGLV
jgi:hypothetical protein